MTSQAHSGAGFDWLRDRLDLHIYQADQQFQATQNSIAIAMNARLQLDLADIAGHKLAMVPVFSASHLLLVSLATVSRVAVAMNNQESTETLKDLIAFTQTYRDLRNAFEHFDERVPGAKHFDRVGSIKDCHGNTRKPFLRYSNNCVGMGTELVDVGRKAHQRFLDLTSLLS